MSSVSGRRQGALPAIAVLCALIAVAVYHRVGGFEFVFDDQGFLHDNPTVLKGLTGEGFRWALTAFYTGNWHPLTWVSHMLDIQLFGLRPGPHHLVNLAFHVLNTVLLFLLLRRLTGTLWPGAFVAAVFALHPLHVESVAWVAERKDLLSGLLWILAIAAYARYAARPGLGRHALVIVLFALGLTAKPMVVTLPIVLLLLDWWPLGRLPRTGPVSRIWGALLLEKIPLFALAVAAALITYRAQASVGAVASERVYRPAWRIANALVSNAIYVGKAFWPADLAAYYPFPLGGRPAWQVGAALLLLGGLSAAAYAARNRCPALAVGWLWHLVTIAPVLGLVQVGGQARADRYMYLPLIGLGMTTAWCAPSLLRRARNLERALGVAAIVALAALGVAAGRQSETWRTPLSLYSRMLEATRENWVAHHGYATEVQKLGRPQEAVVHYGAAVALNPYATSLRADYASALAEAGLTEQAIAQLQIVIRTSFGNAEANYQLGILLGRAERHSESLIPLREAARLRPWFPPGWDALGVAYAKLGRVAEAEAAFREVLRIDPGNQNALRNLELLHALQ